MTATLKEIPEKLKALLDQFSELDRRASDTISLVDRFQERFRREPDCKDGSECSPTAIADQLSASPSYKDRLALADAHLLALKKGLQNRINRPVEEVKPHDCFGCHKGGQERFDPASARREQTVWRDRYRVLVAADDHLRLASLLDRIDRLFQTCREAIEPMGLADDYDLHELPSWPFWLDRISERIATEKEFGPPPPEWCVSVDRQELTLAEWLGGEKSGLCPQSVAGLLAVADTGAIGSLPQWKYACRADFLGDSRLALTWLIEQVEASGKIEHIFPGDGLNVSRQLFQWGGKNFPKVTPSMMPILKLLERAFREGRDATLAECEDAAGKPIQDGLAKIFDVGRHPNRKKHEVWAVVEKVAKGRYRLIDPAEVK